MRRFASLPVVELDDVIEEKPTPFDPVVNMKSIPTALSNATMRRPMRADDVELQRRRQQVRQSVGSLLLM